MKIDRFVILTLMVTTTMLGKLSAAGPIDNNGLPEYHNFSVEEANKLLPDVEKCMNAINDLKDDTSNTKIENMSPDELQLNKEYLTANIKYINSLMKRLEKAGVILRHMKVGLVDFPHMREGRVVYLCWQAGENKIRYWHEINGGKAGRKPLYF